MKITERRLRSIIRSVIRESQHSDNLSGGHAHMGPDPVQALGPAPSEPDETDINNVPHDQYFKWQEGRKHEVDRKYHNVLDDFFRGRGY